MDLLNLPRGKSGMDHAIEIEHLSFAYPDGTAALHDVSLSIKSGESIGLVGPNGAGKSTLVNHFNGYFLPQNGRITVNGVDLTKKTSERIRKDVGLVFQNPDDQLFMPRVWDDAAFGPTNLGWQPQRIQEDVERILRHLGVWELRERAPFHLSQGQKRFAAFATILVMQPSIIVMDEPTSDLDPRNRRKLIDLVKNLAGTRISVSHDLDFIWDVCDRVVVISSGKIAADGATREILSSKDILERNGLELPLRLQR